MQLWKLTGKDDRGARVVFRDPMYGRSRLSPEDREVFSGPNYKTTELVLIVVIAASLLIQVVQSIVFDSSMKALIRWTFAVGFGAFGYFVIVPPIRAHLWNSKWTARYKAIRRCPACQYDIKGCEPQADECTVCPECSGAWRIPSASTVPQPLPQRAK